MMSPPIENPQSNLTDSLQSGPNSIVRDQSKILIDYEKLKRKNDLDESIIASIKRACQSNEIYDSKSTTLYRKICSIVNIEINPQLLITSNSSLFYISKENSIIQFDIVTMKHKLIPNNIIKQSQFIQILSLKDNAYIFENEKF